MTHAEVQQEIKSISLQIIDSKEPIPSIFSNVKYSLFAALVYFAFYIACAFTDLFIKNVWEAIGGISIFFWIFLTVFFSGYGQVFSRLPKSFIEKSKLLSIYKSRLKVYYLIWVLLIFVWGVISILTVYNILVLSLFTLITTISLGFVFSLDISRYQMSSLFGAISAAKAKVTEQN